MVQKFYDDNLNSKFIKHLLATENIPLCNVVCQGDMIFKDHFYIYNTVIIWCKTSGIFYLEEGTLLEPSSVTYPERIVDPKTGQACATYTIIRHYCFNEYIPKLTYNYKSNVTYYDPQTHFHLGKYLRYKSAVHGINLMPFYNCYSGQTTDEVYMKQQNSQVSIVDGSSSSFKIFCVPIIFNKDYTIAVDCSSEVQVGFRIYDSQTGIIYDSDSEDISKHLADQNFVKYTSAFSKPFLARCVLNESLKSLENLPSTEKTKITSRLFSLETYLQMIIQVPSDNVSSLVVLEGDYTSQKNKIHNLLDPALINDSLNNSLDNISLMESQIDYLTSPLLLSINAGVNYAFTGRLMEHLLLNSINSQEELTHNIVSLQNLLCRKDPLYNNAVNTEKLSFGVWNDRMDKALKRQFSAIQHQHYLDDINGEFNVDIERYYQNIRKVNLTNV